MLHDKNMIAEIHYFYIDTPNKIEFKVLHNFYSVKDVPWPVVLKAGLSHKVHIHPDNLIQSDYIHRESTLLSHNLWTCDCDPRKGDLYIYPKSAIFCSKCSKTIKDFKPRHKYWYEVFPYEVKDYEYNKKEIVRYINDYYDFIEKNPKHVS
jgi:hypothetical protein